MRPSRALVLSLVFAFALRQKAPANLVTDGTFTNVTDPGYTGPALTTLFGQFGTGTGSVLTVGGWTTTGYNFVYTPGTADSGTSTAGANSGQPNQAPGQATYNGYGNTYMWGPNNSSTTQSGGSPTSPVLPTTPPGGGNFIAADGAYEVGAISQVISGLTVGKIYSLTFSWAGGQQQGYTAVTTESWTVTLGTGVHSTATITNVTEGFTGWMTETMYYYATSTQETLSFLAYGTPNGQPPFSFLTNVDLESVPDYSSWIVFAGFGVACILLEAARRRRHAALAQAA